jgi:hypothetical protein
MLGVCCRTLLLALRQTGLVMQTAVLLMVVMQKAVLLMVVMLKIMTLMGMSTWGMRLVYVTVRTMKEVGWEKSLGREHYGKLTMR